MLILGLALGALLIFRKDITGAIGGFKFPEIKLPFAEGFGDFKFPDFDIKFPDITFPSFEFPSFDFLGDLFGGEKPIEDVSGKEFELNGKEGMFGEGTTFDPNTGIIEGDTPPTVDLGVSPSQLDPLGEISFNLLKSQTITSLIKQGFDQFKVFERFQDVSFFDSDKPFKFLGKILEEFNPPADFSEEKPLSESTIPSTVGQSLGTEQVFTGGGVGFQGGFVSENPVDTLTEVLKLFPQLTASQAADFLGEFSGISPSEAILKDPDIINITGDPQQPIIINPASQESLTGLTPQGIFDLLFPNVKSNF